MSAPDSVARAVMEALECRRWTDSQNFSWCGPRRHSGMTRWTDRGCSLAVRAADAAWEASLLDAADDLDQQKADIYPTDIFGDNLTQGEWRKVRDQLAQVGLTIDRVSANYYRRALGLGAHLLRRRADESEAAK